MNPSIRDRLDVVLAFEKPEAEAKCRLAFKLAFTKRAQACRVRVFDRVARKSTGVRPAVAS